MLQVPVKLSCDTCTIYPKGASPERNWHHYQADVVVTTLVVWGVMGPVLPEGWLFEETSEATNTQRTFCSQACQGLYHFAQAVAEAGEPPLDVRSGGWCRELNCFGCNRKAHLARVPSYVYPPGWGEAYLRRICSACATPEYLEELREALARDRRQQVAVEEYTQWRQKPISL